MLTGVAPYHGFLNLPYWTHGNTGVADTRGGIGATQYNSITINSSSNTHKYTQAPTTITLPTTSLQFNCNHN